MEGNEEKNVIKIFFNKSAIENANYYFELAKKYKKKYKNAKKAIEELKKKEEKKEKEEKIKQTISIKPYFFTSKKHLMCIAGRNAEENETLLRTCTENDLLFHANIHGGSVVVLKDGLDADIEDKLDAACYAGCYSKGWVNNYSAIDVYAFKKEQVYKESQKTGSFNIEGKREWFKHCVLRLKIALIENNIFILPYRWQSNKKIEKEIEIRPGNLDKNEAAKIISKFFQIDESSVKQLLPQGKFVIIKK